MNERHENPKTPTFHFPLPTFHPTPNLYAIYVGHYKKEPEPDESGTPLPPELGSLGSWVAVELGSCGVGEIVAGANAKFVCSPNNGSHFFCFALSFVFFCCIWYFI